MKTRAFYLDSVQHLVLKYSQIQRPIKQDLILNVLLKEEEQ